MSFFDEAFDDLVLDETLKASFSSPRTFLLLRILGRPNGLIELCLNLASLTLSQTLNLLGISFLFLILFKTLLARLFFTFLASFTTVLSIQELLLLLHLSPTIASMRLCQLLSC